MSKTSFCSLTLPAQTPPPPPQLDAVFDSVPIVPDPGRSSVKTSSTESPFERVGKCLYRKGGAIYARVQVNGKPNWRSTGTNNPGDARKWLEKWRREQWMQEQGIETMGITLHRQRVTVGELIRDYALAKC